MTDDWRAGDLGELIKQCDSIMAALEDLGVDGDDADFHNAVAYTENARQQVGWLRQEFDTARAAIASVSPSSASVAPQPEETE